MSRFSGMRMGHGVEWAAHCCLLLDWLGSTRPVPASRLAAAYELPPAYLNKQLQALVHAGLLTSTPGPAGGFRLALPLAQISMLDVVLAVEGDEEAFRCTEIRRCGVGASTSPRAFTQPCEIAAAMHAAELQWRVALAEQRLVDIRDEAERRVPHLAEGTRRRFAGL